YRTKMILQVHDELLFEVPPEELEEMRRLVPEYMANAVPLVVPLNVDVGVGANWGALLEVEEDAEELELIGAEA
ncbi:MAG: DNA polymerase, partial [Chloroflexota bacterium]